MKKLFTLLLAIIASIGTIFAWNYTSVKIGDLYYNLDATNLTAEVTYPCYYCSQTYSTLTSVTIPESVSYNSKSYSVTRVGEIAFSGCTTLTNVTIGNNVTYINEFAFASCTGLTSVIIGKNVEKIDAKAFNGCTNLTSITWNAKNYTASTKPFYIIRTQITSFTFGEEVEYIPAFLCQGMSNLSSITIPISVTSIGTQVFEDCSSMTSIIWNAKNCSSPDDNYTSPFYFVSKQITSFTFGEEVQNIPDYLCAYMEHLPSIIIPNSVTNIGYMAFFQCYDLENVTIGDNVKRIGYYAFYACSMKDLIIPNSVTYIGRETFRDCTDLENVTIGTNVAQIDTEAFRDCDNIKSVTWNAKNCNSEFSSRKVESFVFGDSVEVIPSNICYSMKKLTSIIIPNSVKSIGEEAFKWCESLSSVTIGKNVENIADEVFTATSITSVIWNAKKCNGCFLGSQVETFVFGDEVEVIPSQICNGMYRLTSITIPKSVIEIGDSAFFNCTSLTSVAIPDNVTCIGKYAFYNCSDMTSAKISDNVETIADWTFGYCSKLTSIEIPNSVINIGESAFRKCTSLTSIEIPNNVTYIEESAFRECTSLTNIDIPNSVTDIGYAAFYECSDLTSVTIGENVDSIADWAFGYCSKLTCIEIPDKVTSIGEYAFYNCPELTNVIIGENVETIADKAFGYYSNLSSITCKATTPPICGTEVFEYVDKSIPLYVPEESIDLYRDADVWKEFTNILPIAESPTAIEEIVNRQSSNRKFVKDDQIFILHGDHTYTLTGQQVK